MPRTLDPRAKSELERVGQELVARVYANAIVEAAGEAGLELDLVAVLAVAHVAGVGELMRVLHRCAFTRAAREQQLDADVAGRQAVQLDGDLDRHRFAELDALPG